MRKRANPGIAGRISPPISRGVELILACQRSDIKRLKSRAGRRAFPLSDSEGGPETPGMRRGSEEEEEMREKLEQVAQWIIHSKRTVVFVGAGLSTESGIPDFRSPGGVWDRYNPEDYYFQNFLSSEASREKYWKMSTEMYEPMKKAQPNLAHRAIAEMERLGKLDCVITQNIDGLHFKAGNSKEKVIELHGTAMSVSCLHCGKKYDRDEIQDRLGKGFKVPYCDDCRGPLKPETVSFGQPMPEKETEEAYRRSSLSDLFIVIGSSLVVQPAASMPLVAKRNGARLVILNRDPTPYDEKADIVIHGQAGPTMASILEHVIKGILKE